MAGSAARATDGQGPNHPCYWVLYNLLALWGAASLGALLGVAAATAGLKALGGAPPIEEKRRPPAAQAVEPPTLRSPGPTEGPDPRSGGERLLSAARPAPPADAAAADDPMPDLASALARGERGVLPRLQALAARGHAPAQLLLGSLYHQGGVGLARDPAAARLWFRAAAEGGDRIAMYNLGLSLANGDGGPRNTPEGRRWLRRAAALGVIDAQHNLALLQEAGVGGAKDLREAYLWFTIAADAGDLPSREKMLAIESSLTARERTLVRAEAARFRQGADPPPPALLVPPAATLADSQKLLARSGRYVGPTDGSPDAAFEVAAREYLAAGKEAQRVDRR